MGVSENVDILSMVRARLFAREPFWAALASYLDVIEDKSCKTGSTNGRVLRYNPEFMVSLPVAQRETFLAHETAHCALRHPWRVGARDPKLANMAADYCVNEVLEEAGFEPIPGWLRDKRFDGMTFEQVYSKLAAEQSGGGQPGQQGGGQQAGAGQNSPGKGNASPAGQSTQPGKGSPTSGDAQGQGGAGTQDSPTGDFTPAPAEAGDPSDGQPGGMSEADWEIAVEQAVMTSRAAGSLPGAFGVAVQKAKEPRVDWISELRQFVTHNMPSDLSWTTPNRRFIHMGVYLPGTSKENTGEGVLAIDCSGSTAPYRQIFANEFGGIIKETRPERLHVIYWDAKAHIPDEDVEVVTPDDLEIDMKPRGNGGTVFQPVFDYVAEKGIQPAFMVVLTDLYFMHPKDDPGYPVLWAVPDYCNQAVPAVGQVLYIPKED